MARHHNITGELTQELLAPGDNVTMKSISLANISSSNSVAIDLFIQKDLTGKFYFFKGLSIPTNTSYIYEASFNNKTNEFGLYVKCTGTSPTVDVIIS